MQHLHKVWMSSASHSKSPLTYHQATTKATPIPSPNAPRPPSNHLSTCQDLRRMLLQHLFEVPARMAGGMLCHRFRGAHHHDLSSLISPIRTEINDPVGTADHIEVVLDHEDRVALIHQALHHIHQWLGKDQKASCIKGLWDPQRRKPKSKPSCPLFPSFRLRTATNSC